MTTDPEKVPESPVYRIILTSSGTAAIDGEVLPISGGSADEARVAALYEIRIKAALHGRPVRVTAKEADGSVWPLIVDVDGSVMTCDHPHLISVPSLAPPSPPASPQAPQGIGHRPPPLTSGYAAPVLPDEAPVTQAVVPEAQAADWLTPLPERYRVLWEQLRMHQAANALVEAIIVADEIERALAEQYGRSHPHTVNVLTVRAWLAFRCSTEWAEAAKLLIEAAHRRQEADASQDDTARLIRNAHAAWCKLTADDPEYAHEMAGQMMTLLGTDERRARDIIRWVESGAAKYSTT